MSTDERLISKKSLKRAYHNWIFFAASVFNDERMMGPALVRVFEGLKDELYPGDVEKQKELLKRHNVFFNTQVTIGAVVPGVIIGMEEERARGADVSDEIINGVKTALMGPFAGIGDSLIQGTLIPIIISIALGMSQGGSPLGVLFMLASYFAINIPLAWFLFERGYRLGAQGAADILSGPEKGIITGIIDVIGLIVVGAVTASYANINLGLVYTNGELSIAVNDMLNKITPKLLVIIFAMLYYWLMKKKKWSAGKMILLSLLIAVIGYFTHILA